MKIMTIHKSKGLEFPVVFIGGLGKEFNRFETRFEKVHSDFKKTYNDMQDVSITTNKIIQRIFN